MTLTSLVLINAALGAVVVFAIVRLLAAGINAGSRVPADERGALDELRGDTVHDQMAA